MSSTKLLRDAGEALYGSHWQSTLARNMDMSDRHMRRLAAGEADLTPGMASDLWHIAKQHIAALDEIAARLKEYSES